MTSYVDLQRHVDCTYFNPLEHRHAARAADWGTAVDSNINAGERT